MPPLGHLADKTVSPKHLPLLTRNLHLPEHSAHFGRWAVEHRFLADGRSLRFSRFVFSGLSGGFWLGRSRRVPVRGAFLHMLCTQTRQRNLDPQTCPKRACPPAVTKSNHGASPQETSNTGAASPRRDEGLHIKHPGLPPIKRLQGFGMPSQGIFNDVSVFGRSGARRERAASVLGSDKNLRRACISRRQGGDIKCDTEYPPHGAHTNPVMPSSRHVLLMSNCSARKLPLRNSQSPLATVSRSGPKPQDVRL